MPTKPRHARDETAGRQDDAQHATQEADHAGDQDGQAGDLVADPERLASRMVADVRTPVKRFNGSRSSRPSRPKHATNAPATASTDARITEAMLGGSRT